MGESQAEIRAIKAKLQSLQARPQTQSQLPSRSQSQSQSRLQSQPERPVQANSQAYRQPHPAQQLYPAQQTQVPLSTAQPRHSPSLSDLAIAQPRLVVDRSAPPSVQRIQPVQRTQSVQRTQIDLPPIAPLHSGVSGQAEPPADPIDWEQSPAPRYSSSRSYPESRPAQVEPLPQKFGQLHSFVQPDLNSSNAALDEALERLDAQAQQVNQLAAAQETAILELKAIAEQIEQDWKTLELVNAARAGYDASDLEIPPLCEYGQASVPKIEKNHKGVLVLTAQSIDLFRSEREAALTAQALRHRIPSQIKRSWAGRFSHWLLSSNAAASGSRLNRRPRKPHRFGVQEAMILFIGAVVVRVSLKFLLIAHPGLLVPAIAIMVTPGAIALYKSTVTPRTMRIWGCRLIMIMIGFWIGGRIGI